MSNDDVTGIMRRCGSGEKEKLVEKLINTTE
jgi:hypothetical protein